MRLLRIWLRLILILFGVRLVGAVLLTGALHADLEGHCGLVDLVVIAVCLEASGDDLEAHGFTGLDHVDYGLSVFVGLELHIAIIVAMLIELMKDNGGIFDGLAGGIAENGDFNLRCDWHSLVLAATLCVGVLGVKREGGESKDGKDDAN